MRSKDFLPEKWSQKYKGSINCSSPKGFSQRAHCQGRKKTNEGAGTENEFLTIMKRLLPIAMKELGLNSLPKFKLVTHVSDVDQPTFGSFVVDENLIWLAVENRHPIDIARTLAHELVHFKQNQDDRLDVNSGDTGSEIENEAHAIAGIIMRNFNKKYPEHFAYTPVELSENFADGKNPQDKGDSKRHGINTKASVSTLRKVAKQGGRKGQLAHWMANMKAGRAKKK
jgi:hypothetical protein